MIAAALIVWAVLFIVGASLFAFTKHEEPKEVSPGPDVQDLMIIEFQARGRRQIVCDGNPDLLKRTVEQAVRVRVVE